MKKLIILAAVFFMASTALSADYMLDGVSAVGASNSLLLSRNGTNHTVSCHYTDADSSIIALTVVLQGSIAPRGVSDANIHWYDLATHAFTAAELASKQAMFHVANRVVFRVRLNITVLTGAGAGDAIYAAYNTGG